MSWDVSEAKIISPNFNYVTDTQVADFAEPDQLHQPLRKISLRRSWAHQTISTLEARTKSF